jgi:hypothetical protein
MDFFDEFPKGLDGTRRNRRIEPLWSFQQNGRTLSRVLILGDGEMLIGRGFDTKELAVQWRSWSAWSGERNGDSA